MFVKISIHRRSLKQDVCLALLVDNIINPLIVRPYLNVKTELVEGYPIFSKSVPFLP